ncbi:hypothetical protein Lalb_Chr24g0398581 [Lupinus albus]|uniref:Uncharacterized protein n=1 Tax=Lupinus albus TaxID=3870 RepID=A0A6A4MR14_LUPAL|nr:hypothetical protein Lalb_Chr24g0398581 [Lupinus albus]
MTLPNAAPFITSPSVYCVARFSYHLPSSGAGNSGFCVGSHAVKSDVLIERRRLKPLNTHTVENNNNNNNNLIKPTFEIPVSCFQVIYTTCCCLFLCICLFHFFLKCREPF